MLKCHWWLRRSLMCTICYPRKSELSSRFKSVHCLCFWKPLYVGFCLLKNTTVCRWPITLKNKRVYPCKMIHCPVPQRDAHRLNDETVTNKWGRSSRSVYYKCSLRARVLIWAWLQAQVNILSLAVGFWLICRQKLQYLLGVLSEKFLHINHAVLSQEPEQLQRFV